MKSLMLILKALKKRVSDDSYLVASGRREAAPGNPSDARSSILLCHGFMVWKRGGRALTVLLISIFLFLWMMLF
jgi:hypothetical protein